MTSVVDVKGYLERAKGSVIPVSVNNIAVFGDVLNPQDLGKY